MKSRSKPGEGQIEPLSSGRFRVRLTVAGKRKTIATCDTQEEAEEVLAAARDLVASGEVKPAGGTTLAAFGREVLDEREKQRGTRGMAPLRGAWKHVERAPFAGRTLRSITRAEVETWLLGLTGARATRMLTKSTLREVFRVAMRAGKVTTNPVTEIRFPKEARTVEPWTYLSLAEQAKLLDAEAIPLHHRLAIAFSMGTGIRSGEQWGLELADVHLDHATPHIVIRYGGRNHVPTKSGKIRTVPLFGVALQAAREWLRILPTYAPENPKRLLFPGPDGEARDVAHPLGRVQVNGKKLCRWTRYVAATLGRRVRWHDLRHTCGASLVSGWWGRRWATEEVRELLGHSSLRQTERYAHLDGGSLAAAAAETTTRLSAHATKPTPAHARENALKIGVLMEAPASARWPELSMISVGYEASWAERGLDTLAEAVQRAIVENDPAAPVLWSALAAQARAAVEATHPVLSIVRRVEAMGSRAEDAAADLAAAVKTHAREARRKSST